jgi:DNA-binding LacI/PurR family transcriptional regulator
VATLKQVAEAAGVSVKTVSRVINHEPEVAANTRQHILEVIEELNYRPNTRARALVSGKAGAVAVVNPAAGEAHLNLFFDSVLRGIAEVLSAHKLDLLLYLSRGDDSPYCELFLQKRVDGLILMNMPFDDPNLLGLTESNAPCVHTCYLAENDNTRYVVDADHAGGIVMSVNHLAALGHRDIAILPGPDNLIAVRLRMEGYRRALAQHGLPVRDELIRHLEFYSGDVRQIVVDLMQLEQQPTAFLCGVDLMAINVMNILRDLGYRVPDDISVLGFNDVVVSQYVSPALTTIRQDGHRKGVTAATMLIDLMSGSLDGAPQQVTLDVELIQRSSTGQRNKV